MKKKIRGRQSRHNKGTTIKKQIKKHNKKIRKQCDEAKREQHQPRTQK